MGDSIGIGTMAGIVKNISIRDMATIKAMQHDEAGTNEFRCQAMDVYLLCARQGKVRIQSSFIPHPLELSGGEAIFLAYPKGEWQTRLIWEADTEYYIVQMEASTLHTMINPAFDSQQINQAKLVNMRDLMKLIPVNPSLLLCFDQLVHHKIQPPFHAIFEQAKFMEIFSLIMEAAFGQHLEACPVMLSPAIEHKIHLVRRHIIDNLDTIPDPDELAVTFELPRNTLKEGYRYLFGKTIHQFHADHKLESAMQMLASGELLVKEIAFRIGYQNPSHFISAFKKKFGFTPKQYLKQEIGIAN